MTPEMEVAVQLATINADALKTVAMAIAAGVGVLGPAIGIGMLVSKALDGIARNPEATDKIRENMILGVVFAEALGIFALVVAFLIGFVL